MTLDAVVAEVLRAHDATSEDRRELAPESVAAMAEAGLLRLLVARRVGGPEHDLATALQLLIEVTEASAAAGWVAMVSTAHDLVMGGFPEEAQDEVYADGLDLVFPGSLATTGALTAAPGGWRLSGSWPFASGAAHGAWFILGTAVREHASRPVPHHVVVPRADLAFDDDWRTLGLRGTGSVTVHATDAFVPSHRAVNTGLLFRAESQWQARHATQLYRTPIVAGLAAHLAAVALGIAAPALADVLDRGRAQGDRYTGARKVDRVGLQMRVAEAEVELRTARLLFDDTLALLGRIADGADSVEARGRARYQAAYSVELCARGIQRLMAASGARAAFDGSVIQRAFRDINMARSHAIGDLDTTAETHGRLLLGLGPGAHPV